MIQTCKDCLAPSHIGQQLYFNTLKTFSDRIAENGYAPTSFLTKNYKGMFSRDASIQVLAHISAGEAENAKRVLEYIISYHKKYGEPHTVHIMGDDALGEAPLSHRIQVDGNYMFVDAYSRFAQKYFDEYKEFIKATFDTVLSFAKYFFESDEFFKKDICLLRNPRYEHGRESRYWDCIDLMTNCYASQGCYDLSKVASLLGREKEAALLATLADTVAEGIHKNLTCEINGKRIYAELIALDKGGELIKGFSFVSFAPIACDWYAVDDKLFADTYAEYRRLASEDFKGFDITSSYVTLDENDRFVHRQQYITGKALAWEIWYTFKTGDTARTQHLLDFLDAFSVGCFDEGYFSDGRLRDTANQEHASWIAYEFARVCGLNK